MVYVQRFCNISIVKYIYSIRATVCHSDNMITFSKSQARKIAEFVDEHNERHGIVYGDMYGMSDPGMQIVIICFECEEEVIV